MPDFGLWAMSGDAIDAGARAVDAWNRILRSPSTVAVQGAGSSIVVRIEHDGTPSGEDSDAGHADSLRCTIFGVKDHPDDTVIDTVIDTGDRLNVGGFLFEVKRVINPPGEIQAFCESV